jgi:hypothetical protein
VDGRNQRFLRLGAVPQKWVTSWTGSVQGSFPIGNAAAQPDLRFAFSIARDRRALPELSPDRSARSVGT